MKKAFFLSLLLAMACMLGLGSCKGCSQSEQIDSDPVAYHDYDGVVQDFTAGVSHIQALHRQTAYALLQGKEYQWRNSRVILNDTITADNIGELHITDINDVFFYWDNGPWVQYVNSNVISGVQIPWPIQDVWIEDADLSKSQIKLGAEDALMRLKEWNGIIPPGSTSITLRLPVGPKDCNAQWVIGNAYDALFIDAVTGNVTDYNPAFR